MRTSPRGARSPACRVETNLDARRATNARGSALLAVLWLSAALSAIAFTVATTVRGETERTSTAVDGIRTYYLATGAIERAILYIQWGSTYRNADGKPKYFESPMPKLNFEFPSGSAVVDLIPETAKLSLNSAPPEQLTNLLLALGVAPGQAQTIAQAMLDWRSGSPGGSFTEFDQHYLTLTPSFRARHASFQEIEELLLIPGVTPDLFYGSYSKGLDGRLIPVAGLRDCLSVYAPNGEVDVNTAEPAVMVAIGVSPSAATAIVALRRTMPIRSQEQLAALQDGSPGFSHLAVTVSSIATVRATARLRLANGQYSDLRRSVSAMVKFLGLEWNPPFHILRWYDNAATLQ